jgi:hypothetical protein
MWRMTSASAHIAAQASRSAAANGRSVRRSVAIVGIEVMSAESFGKPA